MKINNFYKVLNIDREATPSEIKKAYRKAAKRCHPDVSSRKDEKFKLVQEAYETLSDPEKKTTYDRGLRSLETPVSQDHDSFQESEFSPRIFDHLDGHFFDLHDLGSDLFPFDHTDRKVQYLEIILTPGEAREGGEISLEVHFPIPCGRCMGTGRARGLICGRCRGGGEEKLERIVNIRIPAGVRDGIRSSIPVDIPGMARMNLHVTIKIRPLTTRVKH